MTRNRKRPIALALLAGLGLRLAAGPASAQVRDGGIDPWNLGKGDWIYYVSMATNKLGGNVPAVTNLPSLMAWYTNAGVQYLIVKAGTGSTNFNGGGTTPQFNPELVAQAHLKGLKIFGYTRSWGKDIPGEIAMADYVFNQGADGFVLDAEAEWESGNSWIGANGPALALQLCSAIRSHWPTKFLAHAPMPIISYHPSFPYKEFGLYCDAVMPQDYWTAFGKTPTATVNWMDTEWRAFQNSLTGIYTNAIKPLAPVGQADSTQTAAEITEFFNYLKSDPNCVTAGGYRGANFWRADLHSAAMWEAIRTNTIGSPVPSPPVIANISVASTTDTAAAIVWSTDQPSDGAVDFGLTTAYGNSLTNAALGLNHSLDLTGLAPATTYHFRVKSRTAPATGATSADFTFSTAPPGLVSDIIIDNPAATVVGTWSTGTTAPGHYGSDYYFHGPGTGTDSVTFTPHILRAGTYQVFEWHSVGANRTTNATCIVTDRGGTRTLGVNQELNGGQWNLLGAFYFLAGTAGSLRITDLMPEPSGNVVIADAVKFGFVPPPPAEFASITRQVGGQVQLVIRGEAGSLSVLQVSEDLLSWNDLLVFTNTTGTYLYTDAAATNHGGHFYRTRVAP